MNPVEAEQVCQSAEQALRRGSLNLHQFPGLLKRVIEERLWERRKVPGIGIVELRSLRELITAKPRRGWGELPEQIEAVIRDDPETLTLWRAAMKEQGRRNNHNNVMEVKQGNSRAYALDRLQRERPDLYAQVCDKKLSAHAAALQAGFRKQRTPFEELRYWWGKVSPDDRITFLRSVR